MIFLQAVKENHSFNHSSCRRERERERESHWTVSHSFCPHRTQPLSRSLTYTDVFRANLCHLHLLLSPSVTSRVTPFKFLRSGRLFKRNAHCTLMSLQKCLSIYALIPPSILLSSSSFPQHCTMPGCSEKSIVPFLLFLLSLRLSSLLLLASALFLPLKIHEFASLFAPAPFCIPDFQRGHEPWRNPHTKEQAGQKRSQLTLCSIN